MTTADHAGGIDLTGYRGAADVQVPAFPRTIIAQRMQSIKGPQSTQKVPEVAVTIVNER